MKTAFVRSSIEPLESRIAPASLTFTDVDGDKVVITTSGAGTLTLGVNVIVTAGQLQTLDLTSPAFQGPNVTIVATRDPVLGGDGFVNVGYINAAGHDLGTVLIDGDLGAIDAGNPGNPASACKGLTVQSLGRFGTSTGAPDLVSNFDGTLEKLAVKSDVKEARILVSDSAGANARIGSITIGGSLIGGAASQSGFIQATHGIGTVKIGGDMQGGSGLNSGSLQTDGKIASLSIGGSLLGGSNQFSGEIFSNGDMGAVKIGGDVRGGSGIFSGGIRSYGKLASVSVGGSLIGGTGIVADSSGAISSVGDMGAVKIVHDVRGGSGPTSGSIRSSGKLAGVSIGGSLIGGSNQYSGAIYSVSDMGAVTIGHDVQGGSGLFSGRIHSGGKLAGVSMGGSLIGGSDEDSGAIFSGGDMGAVKIGHDVQGGSGSSSGAIRSAGKLASVSIGGSLIGGSNTVSGGIFSSGDIGVVKIGHDLTGGSITGSASLYISGVIESSGRIASVIIGGSIASGTDSSTGNLDQNATIQAGDDIGSLTVKGSLIGNVTAAGASPVIITARGQADLPANAKNDVAIKSITIGGRVEMAEIRGGYSSSLIALNADAQIGTIAVGGDWISSKLIAGVERGPNFFFGDSDDRKITNIGQEGFKDTADQNGNGAISKIAAVIIKGRALGTVASTDNALFGIEAQHLVSIKIGGVTVPLTAGAGNDLFASRLVLGPTRGTSDPGGFDFHAFEVA